MADRYFDLNGATAGFGTLTNSWNTTSAFWSTSSAGTAVPGTFTFTSADRAFFGAAGATATAGTATIVDGLTVTLNNITTANLAGVQTIARNTTGALTLAGTSPSITVNSAGGLTIIAPIGGSTAWTANGTGTLTLGSAIISNTFSGGMTIASGVVQVGNASALGTGTVTMTGGKLSSSSTTGYTLANALSLNGTMTLGDAINTGMLTFSGTTTIAGSTTLTNASVIILSGKLTGSATFAKAGTGEIILVGTTNDNSGAVTISAGTLRLTNFNNGTPNQLSSVSSISVGASGALQICGNTAPTAYTFTVTGTGIIYARNTSASGLTFNGTMSGYTGSLRLYADGADGTTPTQKVTLSAEAQFAYSNFYFQSGTGLSSLSQTLSYTGSGAVTSSGSLFVFAQSASPTAILANDTSVAGTVFTQSGVVQNSNTVNSTLQLAANNGPITVSQVISNPSGVLSLTKTGTYTATLSNANTYSGTVTVSAGTLSATNATALGADTSSGTVASGATLSVGAALNYSTRNFTISGTGVSTGGALVHAFAGTAKIGAITLGAATYVRGTVSGTSTLSSSIANGGFALTAGAASGNTLTLTGGISGLGGLVVGNSASDTGTVALTTANTYQGNTTLSFGTLSVSNATALGSIGSLVFNGGTIDASTTLTVANSLTVSANITFAGTAALTLSSTMALGASRTITTNGSGGALTLSGIVSGSTFKLTKAGTNTLRLTNANTYSGGTDITVGVVQAGNTQALGTTGTVTLSAGTVLQTLTAGGQNGKLTVAALNNSAGGTIRIGG